MTGEHTPGPWHLTQWDTLRDSVLIQSDREWHIATLPMNSLSGVPKEQRMPNAHLIAAAPDMYEALQNLENDDGKSMPKSAWDMCQNALKKARGE